MSIEHWKKMKDPNFLGSWDLCTDADEKGQPIYFSITPTIDHIKTEVVIDIMNNTKKEVPVCYFKNGVKPMILNNTNMKALTKALKSPFPEFWKGKKIIIQVEKVKVWGETHDALRIKDFAPKPAKLYKCADCGRDDVAENVAMYAFKIYSVYTCADCGAKRKQNLELDKELNEVDNS